MSPELSIHSIQPTLAENLTRPLYTAVIPDTTHVGWARTISDWTIKADAEGKMLPKSPEDILALFSKGHSMVLVGEDGKVLSHAGATLDYPDGSMEVGAVCTDENEQRKGYGAKTVEALLVHLRQMYPDRKLITLANEDSVPLFKKLGGTKMSTTELDKEVWSACKDCRRKPPTNANGEFTCCDTPYNLTNFKPVSGRVIFDSRVSSNGINGAHATI